MKLIDQAGLAETRDRRGIVIRIRIRIFILYTAGLSLLEERTIRGTGGKGVVVGSSGWEKRGSLGENERGEDEERGQRAEKERIQGHSERACQ